MTSFLETPATTPEVQRSYDEDVEMMGFVMNASRLWAHLPPAFDAWVEALTACVKAGGLSVRDRGILVTACASARSDAYCSLAWGWKLANATDAATAASVLRGDDSELTPRERAMATWTRKVASDPNDTAATDVQSLRDAGFPDTAIFAITAFVGFRLAFSTINNALGAHPDAGLRSLAPPDVLAAVTYGRPYDDEA